ncbi:hypothetical protein VPH35_085782 [Triticum aestivum]
MVTSPTDMKGSSLPVVPDYVIMDILARLPAKLAGWCRCLSRGWATTLSSDDFADRHHRLANHRHSPRQDNPNGAPSTLLSPKAANAKRPLRVATPECHGLAVFQTLGTRINYLCNPSTGQMATLPEPQNKSCLGLGYDAHTKIHTVVRIHYQGLGCDHEGLPWSVECDLYVVNSIGRWRPIHERPPAWVKPDRPSVFAQGHIYWLAEQKIDIIPAEMVIVSFSLADHTFGTLPPPLGMDKDIQHQLTKLDQHLCFISHNRLSSCYEIWLLPEHGAHMWNLYCRMDMKKVSLDLTNPFLKWIYPLATISNGSHILLARPCLLAHVNNYSRLCAYNLATGDVEDIFSESSMVCDGIICSMDATLYDESIISPR